MPDTRPVPRGTCLAFDFGEKRIGVAQGSAEVGIAHPLSVIAAEANDSRFAAIAALIKEWQPDYLVVGLPVYSDGGEHELTRLSRKFGRRLHRRFALPVYWADERLTSLYAESLLAEARVFGKKQKTVLDSVAAQAILQGFFHGGAAEMLDGAAEG